MIAIARFPRSIQLCFCAETGPAMTRRFEFILHAVLKVGTWVTAGRFPGKGRVGCWLEALGHIILSERLFWGFYIVFFLN